MKIKYLLLAMATFAVSQSAFAQYSQDAIRFSTTNSGSTSRIKAIGNAQTAIGGDLSSISGNPAGLGYFTHSELSITPEFNQSQVNGSYLGNSSSAKRSDGNLNNASVVFYGKLNTPRGQDKTKGWLSVNFGASYARTYNYYQNTNYSAINRASSIADYYADLANFDVANNYSLDGYLEGWAYRQQLINNNGNASVYSPSTTLGGTQTNNIITTGGQTEYNFSLGANYSNKFYIGAGLGIAHIRYNSTNNFIEDNYEYVNVKNDFISTFGRDQVTTGDGLNLKLGFIYKPIETVRIGASITTPTWFTITDNTAESLATNFNGGTRYTDGDTYDAKYNLRTPLKVSGGLAVFIKQFGFITGDIDYIDYSSTHLSSEDFDVTQDNNDIKRNYQSAINTRFGAEARVTNQFYLRGGYGIMGSPAKINSGSTKTASGGLGFRFSNYYIDATYTHVTNSNTIFPYEIGDLSPSAELNRKYDNVFLTVGLRF